VTPTDVRYGFNGKEVDSEINGNGNAYDFGARMYDARLGRSYSLDPKLALTPFHSGYSFFSNNPIYFIDKDGKIIEVATESSKKSFNTAIQTVFNDNDEAIAALSISEGAMAVRSISVEDYNKIMQSLNSIDQQAAFRGLYLASQSQSKYLVQVIEGNEKAFLNGDAVSTKDLRSSDGVSFKKDETNSEVSDAPIFDIAISKERSGIVKNWDSNMNNVYRSEAAMVLGTIVTVFLHRDPSVKNENFYIPLENNVTVTAIQCENIIMKASGNEQFSGENFYHPDGSKLSSEEMKKVAEIPEQLRFINVHYTSGVEQTKTLPSEQ
jgi:RHS repeat-associated protein